MGVARNPATMGFGPSRVGWSLCKELVQQIVAEAVIPSLVDTQTKLLSFSKIER